MLAKYIHTKLIGASFGGIWQIYKKNTIVLYHFLLSSFTNKIFSLIFWLWLHYSQPLDTLICLKLQNDVRMCTLCFCFHQSFWLSHNHEHFIGVYPLSSNFSTFLWTQTEVFSVLLSSRWCENPSVSVCVRIWVFMCVYVFVFYGRKRCVN